MSIVLELRTEKSVRYSASSVILPTSEWSDLFSGFKMRYKNLSFEQGSQVDLGNTGLE